MKTLHLIPLLLLSACASNRTPTVLDMPRPVPGMTLPSEGIESVRYSENLKAYNIAKWNLHPNAPATVALGPAVQIIDPARKDGPTTPEVIAEVNRQKAATQMVIDQGKRLNDTLTQISSALDASKQVADQNRQLKSELDLTKQRLDLLEAEIRNQQQANPAPRGTPETTNQNW